MPIRARQFVLQAVSWLLVLTCFIAVSDLTCRLGAASAPKATPALHDLSRKINGALLFTLNKRIYKMSIGEWKPVDLGSGTFARWRTDGAKIAVYDKGQILVMDDNGGNRRRLAEKAAKSDHETSVIEFHGNQSEIIYINSRKQLTAVDINSGKSRSMGIKEKFTGEPGISSDGKRMAARNGHDLYAIDLANGTRREYAGGCSSGISPDGKWLMNNVGSHRELVITSWDTGRSHKLKLQVKGLKKPVPWDNHHWSNHPDYITSQTDKKDGGLYIIQVSNNLITHLNIKGEVTCPDLYIDRGGVGGTVNIVQKTKRREKNISSSRSKGLLYVNCRLIETTVVPPPSALKDYARAMTANLYQVVSNSGKLKAGETIIVCHWVYNQRKRIPIKYESKGKTYRFQLSQFEAYPKLEAERLIMELDDFESEMYVCMDAWGKKIMREFN